MTTNSDMLPKKKRSEIVRLKIDGADTTVNTLGDQQTEMGVSLVCPFPALEVSVPVKFSSGPHGELISGNIHRIGVEDDPETGLPRLRLAIRTNELDSTESSKAPIELPLDAIGVEANATPAVSSERNDGWDRLRWSDSPILFDETQEQEVTSDIPGGSSLFLDSDQSDPAWVECREMPMPEDILARMRSRRRYKLARAAAWVLVFAMLGGCIAALERAEYLDFSPLTKAITGFSLDGLNLQMSPDDQGEPEDALAALAMEKPESTLQVASEGEIGQATSLAAIRTIVHDVEIARSAELVEDVTSVKNEEIAPEVAKDSLAVEEVEVEEAEVEAVAVEKLDQDNKEQSPTEPNVEEVARDVENDVTLVLPTRWPAEYATAYRVRNPNGVVVDIPGGLVKREGWLEALAAHKMVRSVKAVQRETGARFIVYVHGELPRFVTSPRKGGISLRLYHTDTVSAVATDEVAMLQ